MSKNTFYVRDVSGKEIAIYSGSSLTQWNMWGLDNVGKINADTTKYYYLKDQPMTPLTFPAVPRQGRQEGVLSLY